MLLVELALLLISIQGASTHLCALRTPFPAARDLTTTTNTYDPPKTTTDSLVITHVPRETFEFPAVCVVLLLLLVNSGVDRVPFDTPAPLTLLLLLLLFIFYSICGIELFASVLKIYFLMRNIFVSRKLMINKFF